MGFWFAIAVLLVVLVFVSVRKDNDDPSGQSHGSQTVYTHARQSYGTSDIPVLPPSSRRLDYAYLPQPARQDHAPSRTPPPRPPGGHLRTHSARSAAAPSTSTLLQAALPLSSAVLREQAAEEGRLMEESFTQSKIVRLRGFRADARKLAQKGKEHQRIMEDLNKTASEMIFLEKNKVNQLYAYADREPHEIDLHGLFVKEAELKVTAGILSCERRGDRVVRFIVGQGIHSDGAAKLKPAIQQHIRRFCLVLCTLTHVMRASWWYHSGLRPTTIFRGTRRSVGHAGDGATEFPCSMPKQCEACARQYRG
ncbi:hypothetical protein B0H10DRAFT_1947316 [Mycena sp. CBHHK59/15]|nr:hypothetical protein B0H10DRAFT_1947316 [Mycena sp. CBHHK59/15]